MTTKQVEPEVDPRREQQRPPRNRNRNKKVGAFLAAAVIGLGAITLILATRGGEDATTPDAESPAVAPVTGTGPFLVDLETGEERPLAENVGGGYLYAPSPDGTRLVYNTCCSGADVATVANIDGTDARTLESPEGLNSYGHQWSPDGTKLVFQERDGGDENALTGDVGNLFVQDLLTGERTQLTELELKRAWWWFLSANFSPDGRNVIFHLPRTRSEATKWDVWSVPVTGGKPTLVIRNATFPDYFPDGREIAFVLPTASNFEGFSIGIASTDGEARRTLVEAGGPFWMPTVSPDGSRIAYQAGDNIHVLDVSSGESPKVAAGASAAWLDNDMLLVNP
jgi:Tol biopolymer transport system component